MNNSIPEERGKSRSENETLVRSRILHAQPEGYEPDEDDPAWPSRSGQAD